MARTESDATGKAYQAFLSTIPEILQSGPKRHVEILQILKRLHPQHCDDTIRCVHAFGFRDQPEYDHVARSAEQALKKSNVLRLDGHYWRLNQLQ